ncbi:response regulator [Oligoflexus tunisiensis]|uniref:response regulator n=1 Tax=Oligoflexus tunisiensis TaxID=708132 RepID=UPI00114CA045|nr:response regulator [Oligoflexus tunisiensis]
MKFSVLTSRLTLGFRRAALLETDPFFASQIQSYANDSGIEQLEVCSDVDALCAQDVDTYDLLILDWNAHGPNSGVKAYNRLRHDPRFVSVPILVMSGFVDRNDFRLLEEFPLTRLVEKPFTAGVFIEAVQSLQNELDWVHAHEKPLRQLLQADKVQGLPRVRKMQKLLQSAPYPAPLLLMFGRYLSREKCWDEAREFLQQVVREDRGNVLALNELGKVLHASGRHSEAIAVLEEADTLSPDNLKRICHLGELHLHQCQLDDARHSFERALTIDARWERAQKGYDLTMNALEYLQKETESGSFPQSFASLMNTIGISKVRSGHLQEGIHHYESALHFIRDHEVKAKVMFNMGLGYLRHHKGGKALLWFMRSARTGGPDFAKAMPYVEELTQKAVWTEQGFKVVSDVTETADAQDDVSTVVHPEARKPESTDLSNEPISLISDDGSTEGKVETDDFDTNALLGGVTEEGFC